MQRADTPPESRARPRPLPLVDHGDGGQARPLTRGSVPEPCRHSCPALPLDLFPPSCSMLPYERGKKKKKEERRKGQGKMYDYLVWARGRQQKRGRSGRPRAPCHHLCHCHLPRDRHRHALPTGLTETATSRWRTCAQGAHTRAVGVAAAAAASGSRRLGRPSRLSRLSRRRRCRLPRASPPPATTRRCT